MNLKEYCTFDFFLVVYSFVVLVCSLAGLSSVFLSFIKQYYVNHTLFLFVSVDLLQNDSDMTLQGLGSKLRIFI